MGGSHAVIKVWVCYCQGSALTVLSSVYPHLLPSSTVRRSKKPFGTGVLDAKPKELSLITPIVIPVSLGQSRNPYKLVWCVFLLPGP